MSVVLFSGLVGAVVDETPEAKSRWTVLLHGAVDNDWEEDFMRDVHAVRQALAGAPDVEVILLIDRSPRYSRDEAALGEDFADPRLYRLTGGAAERLSGGRS